MFRKIRPNNLDKINRLQSMKKHPIGGIGGKDARINKLINKLYNRKELRWKKKKLHYYGEETKYLVKTVKLSLKIDLAKNIPSRYLDWLEYSIIIFGNTARVLNERWNKTINRRT